MPIIAKGDKKSFEPIPLGVHQAVCAFVEDIGTHEGNYQGRTYLKHQIVICWELSAKMTSQDFVDKPFMVSKFYTLSLNEKANLRKDLENWRGKVFTEDELNGFDIEVLKGINCMLNIVEYTKLDGSKSQKIGAIMPAIKGMPTLLVENRTPPEWISEMRGKSIEMQEASNKASQPVNATQDEGLPF